jgi:hypothetical protein
VPDGEEEIGGAAIGDEVGAAEVGEEEDDEENEAWRGGAGCESETAAEEERLCSADPTACVEVESA